MTNSFLNMRGTWDENTQYSCNYYAGSILTGLDYLSCDTVSYNNNIYAILGDTKSTIGTTPDEDSAFTLISSSFTSAYGLWKDFGILTIATGSGKITFTDAGTMTSSSNITYSASTITLPQGCTFMVNYNLTIISSTSSAGLIQLAGSNITINGYQDIHYTENTTARFLGSAIVTTSSTATPTLYLYGNSISGTTAISSDNTFLQLWKI